jgi:hypothetical protein
MPPPRPTRRSLLLFLTLLLASTAALFAAECFIPDHWRAATKCFSCEAQFPPDQAWRGQDTKCFDCERQDAALGGPAAGGATHPLRTVF